MRTPTKRRQYLSLLLVAILIVSIILAFLLQSNKKSQTPSPNSVSEPSSDSTSPTLTPKEHAIIANMKTERVEISDKKVDPNSITIGVHDQVQFFNMTQDQNIYVVGKDWGNILLKPGENMTQAFSKAGTYAYTITDTQLKGDIVVK